jgi:hypothetical protein
MLYITARIQQAADIVIAQLQGIITDPVTTVIRRPDKFNKT